jgi:hypothetical protein
MEVNREFTLYADIGRNNVSEPLLLLKTSLIKIVVHALIREQL